MPLVWIVILHWRGIDHTRACLSSLGSTTWGNFKILLVDNGSDDMDGDTLVKEFPDIELLRLDTNKGFSGGCNAGIELALSRKADFIWLLNNDATVEPQTLTKLVEAAAADTKIGAVSAAIVEKEENNGAISRKLGQGTIDFLNAKSHLKAPESDEITTCDWISGSNMLLRREAVEEVGMLNDDYFLYYEDVEICVRLRQKGWLCALVPTASIEHVDGASTEGDFHSWRYYYYSRNRLLFFSNYPNWFKKYYCLFRIYLHIARHMIVLPLRGEKARKKLEVEWRAFKDFHAGVTGKVDF